MKIDIGVSVEDLEGEVRLLNRLLADEYVLYTKTRNYHWNVKGAQFNQLHLFFQSQYEQLNVVVDDVAERCRAIGGDAIGTLDEFKRETTLREQPGSYPDAPTMIADLLADHEAVIRTLREDVETTGETHNDAGTSGFLSGLLEQHEKMAWMLRAHLETKS
jgi:starvation-inducible DNA-binding protein